MTEQHNPDFVGQQSVRAAERIYHQWDEALGAKDVDAVIALYGPGLRPGVAVRPASVELRGRRRRPTGKAAGIRATGLCAPPAVRQRYRKGFFTDGRTLMWEYPRAKPDGEQMDFVEVMEIRDGLIHRYRVYWGWFGLKLLQEGGHHAK